MQKDVVSLLSGDDRRSLGRADQIAGQAAANRKIFKQLISVLWHPDPIVRMRAADAAAKASRQNPSLLRSSSE